MVWKTIWHLVNFREILYNLYPITPRYVIPECGEDSPKSTPFSPLTPHISHDDSGSKQVDALLTLYKRIKSHSTKVSSTIHISPSLCSKEKTDLIVGRSLTGSHRSPLIVFSFSSGHQAITVARSLQPTDFRTSSYSNTTILQIIFFKSHF